VAERLRQLGVDPVATREPGGTPAGEAIRAVVLGTEYALGPEAELLLMLAARAVFVAEVLRPALAAGRIVLADRYELSTLAYQGGGRGLSLDRIRAMNRLATGGLRPDLCVLLDVDPEEGLARRRGQAPDRIESEDPGFHQRVAEAYRRLAAEEPEVALVNGRAEIGEVHAAVWELLSSRFPETFPPRGC
jgi:dTMP kinase